MNIKAQRHSLSHILAQAIQKKYNMNVKLTIGPNIENGFYYDFDFQNEEFSSDNLKEIQDIMTDIIKQKQEFTKINLNYKEAKKILKLNKEKYKLEMLEKLNSKDQQIGFYINTINIKAKDYLLENAGSKYIKHYEKTTKLLQSISDKDLSDKFITFIDMCKWPHIENSDQIDKKSFKLSKVAGAYWKWNENNKMLTRIYAYAFENKNKLKDHLNFLEEAKKRDHRKIGKNMNLFSFSEKVWLWLPLWHPMWGRLWRSIEDFWLDEHRKAWYEFIRTPHIWNQKLWEQSGHWWFYNESMYPPLEVWKTLQDEQEGKSAKESEKYLLKPMNCPFHVEIYKTQPRSYKELPLRWAELGTVYRYEKKWELGGLTRVRWFTQDDAHIFCRKDQIKNELEKVIDFIDHIVSSFWLEYQAALSFRSESKDKYVGSDEMWEVSQNVLKEVVKDKNLNAPIEKGEAAFYGPKIDFKIQDSIGRWHQCSTVQFDFNLPERFNMEYTDSNGEKQQPYMIHRALLGSFERFIGVLIEHYAGNFPVWIAPRQVIVIPVVDKKDFIDYANKVDEQLTKSWLRSEVDYTDDSLSKKVRRAEKQKINYALIVWEDEIQDWTVSIRNTQNQNQSVMSIQDFIEKIQKEINSKK